MTILDVLNKYKEFGREHPNVFSNFHECSKDDSLVPPTYLVDNLTKCIDFDYAKEDAGLHEYSSADALFISVKLNEIVFIEFKNSSFYGSISKTTKKAFGSIHIHDKMIESPVYGFSKHVFCLVISLSKDIHKRGLMTQSMIKQSSYATNKNYSDELDKTFFEHLSKNADFTSLPFFFDNCHVLFDNNFDSFVSTIEQ